MLLSRLEEEYQVEESVCTHCLSINILFSTTAPLKEKLCLTAVIVRGKKGTYCALEKQHHLLFSVFSIKVNMGAPNVQCSIDAEFIYFFLTCFSFISACDNEFVTFVQLCLIIGCTSSFLSSAYFHFSPTQIRRWGNVEWAHDYDMYELRARTAAGALFVHLSSESSTIKRKLLQD